ncbi:MAG: hypothetical protein RL511_553 [Bacteroidota bacterium]
MRCFLICFLLFCAMKSLAQDFIPSLVSENHPILLVASELDHLVASQIIDAKEAQLLEDFFNRGGYLTNIFQLQGLLNRESTELINIQALVCFSAAPSRADAKLSGQYDLHCILPTLSQQYKQGVVLSKDTNFVGSNFAFQQRISLDYSQWRFGLQIAKDIGEPLWHKGKAAGPEMMTSYLAWKNPNQTSYFQKLVFGAFQIQWGQGLHLWSSRGLGKSIDLLQLARKPVGLRPYQGRDEQRFLNGISGSCQFFKQELLFLASVKHIDAKPPQDLAQPEYNFVYSNCLHRNATEVSRRKQGLEQIYGFGLRHQSALWQGGFLLLHQQVQPRQFLSDSLIDIQIAPLRFLTFSTYAQGTWKQCFLYGELAGSFKKEQDFRQALALNLALVYFLDPSLEFGLHFRNYGAAYQTLYGNPIGNNSMGRNERGLIIQVKWQAFKFVTLSLSAEGVQTPWLLEPHVIPQRNNDVRIVLNYQPSKKQTFAQQFVLRSNEFNFLQMSLQGHFKMALTDADAFSLSYQLTFDLQQKGNSRLIGLNFRHAPLGTNLSLDLHYGLFQVPQDAPILYSQLYILGFGAQSFPFNGLGSYAVGAFKYVFKYDWDLTLSINLRNNFSNLLARETQLLLGIRKKI